MTPTDLKALHDKIEAGAKFEGWYTLDTAADVAAVLEALRRLVAQHGEGLVRALKEIAYGRVDNGRALGGQIAQQKARDALFAYGIDWSALAQPKPQPDDPVKG